MISGAKHIPTPPLLIPEKMKVLILWNNECEDIVHPVEVSAEMDERLETIHPLIKGNSKTSRLLINLILLQNGYPIAILKGDTTNRLAYYNAL